MLGWEQVGKQLLECLTTARIRMLSVTNDDTDWSRCLEDTLSVFDHRERLLRKKHAVATNVK